MNVMLVRILWKVLRKSRPDGETENKYGITFLGRWSFVWPEKCGFQWNPRILTWKTAKSAVLKTTDFEKQSFQNPQFSKSAVFRWKTVLFKIYNFWNPCFLKNALFEICSFWNPQFPPKSMVLGWYPQILTDFQNLQDPGNGLWSSKVFRLKNERPKMTLIFKKFNDMYSKRTRSQNIKTSLKLKGKWYMNANRSRVHLNCTSKYTYIAYLDDGGPL